MVGRRFAAQLRTCGSW